MKVLIRKMKHSDYLGIIDLFNESHNKNIMYHDIETDDNKVIIVAETNNTIIGCAEINIETNEVENYKYSYITNISISKKHQNQSFINLLIQACIKISERNKCQKIILNIPNNQNFETYKTNKFIKINNTLLMKDLV